MTGIEWAGVRAEKPVLLALTEHGELGAPPVVILHGLFGAGRNWMSVARRLADRWHVVTPDLRNHGASPWTDTMSYAAMAADVIELVSALPTGEPCTLVGHSMGGKAAMIVALTRPDLVQRLVLVDVAPVAYPPVFGAYADAMAAAHLDGVQRRSEVDVQLAAAVPAAGVRSFLLQNLVLLPGGGARWRMNLPVLARSMGDISGFPLVPRGVSYERSTRFVVGGQSHYVTPAALPEIGRLFPGARLIEVADAGHWVHAEQPLEFVTIMRDILEGRSAV